MKSPKKKKLLMVINEDRFFLSHRSEIAVAAMKKGWEVTLVTKNTGHKKTIESMGLNFIELPINPTGLNIFQELNTLRFLRNLYKKNRDAVVHHVGLKNILWGSLACRTVKMKGVVNAVSGMGTLFSNETSFLCSQILRVLSHAMKGDNLKVIFQNNEDKSLFIQKKIIKENQTFFIKGSGVDLEYFTHVPEKTSGKKLTILFAGRMIKEKGVLDLIKAAEILRPKYENKIHFILCGELSSNPNALSVNEISKLTDDKYISWLGYRNDMKEMLRNASFVVFPSYYREGVPRFLIETCASGRPIVTTNSIGCKDCVEEGRNGYKVHVGDAASLAERIKKLVDNPTLREKMGLHSRAIAERDFSIDDVVKKHLKIYESF